MSEGSLRSCVTKGPGSLLIPILSLKNHCPVFNQFFPYLNPNYPNLNCPDINCPGLNCLRYKRIFSVVWWWNFFNLRCLRCFRTGFLTSWRLQIFILQAVQCSLWFVTNNKGDFSILFEHFLYAFAPKSDWFVIGEKKSWSENDQKYRHFHSIFDTFSHFEQDKFHL